MEKIEKKHKTVLEESEKTGGANSASRLGEGIFFCYREFFPRARY